MPLRITLELPGKPFGKHHGRPGVDGAGNPHIYHDKRTQTYEAQIRYAAQQAMDGREPSAQPMIVTIEARFPIYPSWPKYQQLAARAGMIRPTVTPDWENLCKVCDALKQVVWRDDKQVVDGRIIKVYSETPGMTIIIEAWEPPAAPLLALPKLRAQAADLFAEQPA